MKACKLEVKYEDVNEKLKIISYLIEHHGDVYATDNDGRTALMYAFNSGCKQTVRWLKKHGLYETVDVQMERRRKSEVDIWASFDLDKE
ncbi:Hypothetical predicted protein [Mytilus galloprovincialis]|uniref:Uncharacterized protein n=1 Tax=Mytilus galloprovincialis TaxID=29158 RepID=A0A8B6DUU4_MYTGA|nr:Hypothetical predicted protein [Mytilus galloprovincialis]